MTPTDKAKLENDSDLAEIVSKLQLAVEASRMGIWEYDEANQRVHWDDRLLEMYGVTDGQNVRTDDFWDRHIHPDDREKMINHSDNCKRAKSDFEQDFRIIRPDGETRYIRSLARHLETPDKNSRMIGVNIDMTDDHRRAEELKKAQDQIQHDALHDVLTGLGNRRRLDDVVKDLFEKVTAEDEYCIVLLDLDHFKQVNDTLGHLAGDFVLQSVATIFSATIGDLGTAFRVGGDEFAGIFPVAPAEDVIIALCETLVEKCAAPMIYDGCECAIGVSIGYAFGKGPPRNRSEIFANADTALYSVKRNGRNGFQAYHSHLKKAALAAANSRGEVLSAIRNGALTCHFQPQYDSRTLEVNGAEALVRWDCPQRGLVQPDSFLPQAQENGLIAAIDEHVLHVVAAQQDAWAAQNLPFPPIAVNTSACRLVEADLVENTRKIIKPHHKINFEILETAMIDILDDVTRNNLKQLRALGIRIELDDFGSGHASVIAMQAIKPDRIKIDRSLVAPIDAQPRQIIVLQALASIARLEGAGIVMEGVENTAHLAAIKNVDCDALQGYGLQRPMPACEFETLIRQVKRRA